jgi:hypothetical protein
MAFTTSDATEEKAGVDLNGADFDETEKNCGDDDTEVDILTMDGGESLHKEEEEAGNQQVARRERRYIFYLRVLVAFVLVVVAVCVSLAVFFYSRNKEQDDFERQFAHQAIKLLDSWKENAKRRVGAIEAVALAFTSHALSTHDRFPFVTLPDFERRVTQTLDQAQVLSLTYLPIITGAAKSHWEIYSIYKQGWFEESMAYQQEEQAKRKSVHVDEAGSVAVLADETAVDGHGKDVQINPVIYRFNGVEKEPQDGPGPFVPVWQFSPIIPVSDIINFDMLSHPSHANEGMACMKYQKRIIGRSFDCSNDTSPEVAGRKSFLNMFLKRWKDGGNDYETGPVCDLYTPIFDQWGENRTMVGMTMATVYWQVYFTGVLADNAHIIAVLENTCGQKYSYVS